MDSSRTSVAAAPATPRGTHSGSPGRSARPPSPRKPPAAGLAPGPPSCGRGSGAPWAARTAHWPGVPSGALRREAGHRRSPPHIPSEVLPGPLCPKRRLKDTSLLCFAPWDTLTSPRTKAGIALKAEGSRGEAIPEPPNAPRPHTHTHIEIVA